MPKKILLIGSERFVNETNPAISSLNLEIESAHLSDEILPKLKKRNLNLAVLDDDSFSSEPLELKKIITVLHRSNKKFIVLSGNRDVRAALEAKKNKADYYLAKPYTTRELNLIISAILNDKKRITCIGGGTGLFNILMGLKGIPQVLLTSIVTMTDSGGSSGTLSESFGILPPGDVRRSLVALSNAPEIMNEIMTYRFARGGGLDGHSLGNLLITALVKIKGSTSEAVSSLGDILNIQGIVRPASTTKTTLCALFEKGIIIKGESNIDLCKGRSPDLRIKKCWHEPESEADINSYSAIINSDMIIIGPGDLYTSVITNFITKDIRDAVVRTKAKKIYICNLMTKPGETSHFNAYDHVKEILKYLKKDCLDYVIIADTTNFSKNAILKYKLKNQFPVGMVGIDRIRNVTRAGMVIADVAHEIELIRHDSEKVKNEIFKIMIREKRK